MMMMKNMRDSEMAADHNSANFNLLDMSSDDDTKQLVLPPLPKSKHAKRKMNGKRPEMIASVDSTVRSERHCSVSAACFISLLVFILLSEIILGVYVYMLKTRIDQVQDDSYTLSPTPASTGTGTVVDYRLVIAKQSSLESSIQLLNTSIGLLENSTKSLQKLIEERIKSLDQSLFQFSGLPDSVEAAASRLSLLEVDVAFLHNATNSLRSQAQTALKNQTQDALRDTLERFQEDIIRMLQKQEENLRNRTLSVVEKEQFNNMRLQLIQLHDMVATVNTSVIQVFEESMEDIQMKFFHINERLTELEDSPGCSIQAHIDNCTAAKELYDELVMQGDKVSVDNIHRQKSNNCSMHYLESHADSDGFYSFSGFTTLLGLNCTEVTNNRKKRSSSVDDIRRMVQSINVEVP